MKLKAYIIISAICLLYATKGHTQEKGYKETMEMTAMENGDINVSSKIKFNASTWEMVKQRRSIEPSVLKNELKKRFPKYVLEGFDIKNDDMEQTTNIKFKILGLLKLDEDGKWKAELDTKNPDITKVTETKYIMVDEGSAQTSTIILPSSASNSKIEKDAFGKASLTYTAPVSGGGMGNIIKYLGFLVAAGGLFLFFKNRGALKTIVVNNPANKKINYNTVKNIDDAVVVNPTPGTHSSPEHNPADTKKTTE